MGSMPINGFGITLEDTKFLKEKPTPVRWKQITPNYVTTWLAWLANRGAFLDVLMLWSVHSAYLSIVSIADNFTSSVFQTMPRM